MRRTAGLGLALAVALVLVACKKTSPAPSTQKVNIPPPSIRITTADPCADVTIEGLPVTSPQATPLPDLTLPCLTGSTADFRLRALGGKPTLITLWASWCAPCRKELPAFQKIAEAGKVKVLGVDSLDEAKDGVARFTQLGLTFPSAYDFAGVLLDNLQRKFLLRRALPVTVFVRADGSVAKVYQAKGFDDTTLPIAIKTYLGVAA